MLRENEDDGDDDGDEARCKEAKCSHHCMQAQE